MTASDDPSDAVDVVDSMAHVEFDVERDRFRAAYDSDRDSPSLAVVAVVATALHRDPLDLSPLHDAADTGALEGLASEPSGAGRDDRRASFRYEGFDVTVSAGGTVEAAPAGRA